MVEQAERSVCMGMSCGAVFDGPAPACPQCGARAIPQASIRRRGWLMMACGVILLGIMGGVLCFVTPLLLANGGEVDGARFAGTGGDRAFALTIFGMVIVVGLGALWAGAVQAFRGRRARGVIMVILVISGMLFAIGLLIRRGVIT